MFNMILIEFLLNLFNLTKTEKCDITCNLQMYELYLIQPMVMQFLLNELGVTFNTANSINWGRILFQIVYHIHSYLSLVQRGTIKPGDPVDVCKFKRNNSGLPDFWG